MNATRARAKVHVAANDPSLTAHAGLLLLGELVAAIGLIGRINAHLPGFKRRDRGLSPGQFLVSVAESLLAGGDHLADLEELRADRAGASLRAVACPPAPTTAGSYFRRFHLRHLHRVERAMAEAANHLDARLGCSPGVVTLDADATGVEVFGPGKQGTGWSYEGARGYQPFLVSWAERRRVLAADLLAGNEAPVARATGLLHRALRCLPKGATEVRLRADSGFYSAPLMAACRKNKVRFSVSAKRTTAIWREIAAVPDQAFLPAIDMAGAEVAEATHHVDGVGECRLIIRRVEIDATSLPSVRGRRRRTIAPDQLALALEGRATRIYAYSAIVADLAGEAREIERFHRRRTDIEELIKDAKLGVGMRHMPMGHRRANAAWMLACLLALNLSSLLHQAGGGVVRAHGKRVRRELVGVPGRVVRSGRRTILRLPAGLATAGLFVGLYATLRALGPPG